jgi:small subunit ribosomal protein S21
LFSGLAWFNDREALVVKIKLRPGESLQTAVKRFRRLCERAGLPREIRRRAYYQKPSELKRRARLRQRKKLLKQLKKQQQQLIRIL